MDKKKKRGKREAKKEFLIMHKKGSSGNGGKITLGIGESGTEGERTRERERERVQAKL